jgi:hypothetical protein
VGSLRDGRGVKEKPMKTNHQLVTALRGKLPIALSVTAIASAVLVSTPVGRALNPAAQSSVPKAGYALNAGAVNRIRASRVPRPGMLLALDKGGRFPSSVGRLGPAGLKGDKGDTGSEGPQGPAGLTGLSGWGYHVGGALLDPKRAYDLRRPCPPPQKVLGGGVARADTSNTSIRIVDSSPALPVQGWRAYVYNGGNTTATVYVWAICANESA